MISTSPQRDSETLLMESVHKLADAGGSVIQIRTREPVRAALVLRKHLLGSDIPLTEWDVVNGMRVFTKENYTDHKVTGDGTDFIEALKRPLDELRNPVSQVSALTNKIHFFVYVDPQPFLHQNPYAAELLQQYAAILPSTNVCTILITPEITLADIPLGTVLITDLPTPGAEELQDILERVVSGAENDGSSFPGGSELSEVDYRQIALLGRGLSLYEFETYAAISIIDASLAGEESLTAARLMDGIGAGKTGVVRQSEILELTHWEDIGNIGGMQRMKDWLSARSACFSDNAKEFGIESPKGMVLVGVPGTGKSLAAKVTAAVLGVPLVRLDFGRVFSKYVGDSESRVRAALKMVETMAPVVLFVDEIDKGLGGAEGGGDSGTASRVLGSYLTWLQECTAPVFSVVTANRVDGLPPELLRRGRFDQVFSVGLPSAEERREVLEIHLRKRNRSIDAFSEADLELFDTASKDYVPAEIESAVKDAIIASYNKGAKPKDLAIAHITTALTEMVPMSKSHKATVDRIIAWARDNATPVSYPVGTAPPTLPGGGRVIRATRRGA